MNKEYLAANFYKFIDIDNPKSLLEPIKKGLKENDIKGTVLLAKEGLNTCIAGKSEDILKAVQYIKSLNKSFEDLDVKYSRSDIMPFSKLKVKVKKEIVTFNQPNLNPAKITGIMVDSIKWNELLNDKNVLVIDTRNNYEIAIGTFKNAINPDTENFSQFANFVERLDLNKYSKIAMYCTGGIRCEKASSYMLSKGFREVYQLDGGILKYLNTIPKDQSLWEGRCFVFDSRSQI